MADTANGPTEAKAARHWHGRVRGHRTSMQISFPLETCTNIPDVDTATLGTLEVRHTWSGANPRVSYVDTKAFGPLAIRHILRSADSSVTSTTANRHNAEFEGEP